MGSFFTKLTERGHSAEISYYGNSIVNLNAILMNSYALNIHSYHIAPTRIFDLFGWEPIRKYPARVPLTSDGWPQRTLKSLSSPRSLPPS